MPRPNPNLIDLTGQTFNRWTVLSRAKQSPHSRSTRWRCKCACGTIGDIRSTQLRQGVSMSCGCLVIDIGNLKNKTHGHSQNGERKRSQAYEAWGSMKSRCLNAKHAAFARYGGRGIRICERWKSFENFLADMGEPPTKKHTLDRENNNGDYEPSNCRWATWKQQQQNRRNNRIIEFNGERRCAADWADKTGLSRYVIYWRIRQGMPPAEIFGPLLRVRHHSVS